MIKEKSFEKFFENLQKEQVEINEVWKAAKQEKKKRSIIIFIVCTILCVIIDIKIINLNIDFPEELILVKIMWIAISNAVIIIFFIALFGKGKKQKEFNITFKTKVIQKIMDNFYGNLEYFPKKQMPQAIYNEAKYNEYYNRYNSDDYLEALIDNKYTIDMAEILTQKEERHTDSDGHTSTSTYTIFHGLFAKIVIDKSINCELKIKRNGYELLNKNRLEMDSRGI